MLQYGVQSPAATASVEPSLAQGGLRGGLRERRCLLPPSCSSCRPHRFATATQSTPLVTISVAVAMQVSPLKVHMIHSSATPQSVALLPKTFSCYSVSQQKMFTSLLIHLVVFWDQTKKLLRGMRHLEASIVYLPCVLTSNGGFSSGKP